MYDKPDELLTDDINCKIDSIDRELDEFKSSITKIGRIEEETLDDLWKDKKGVERAYDCGSGPLVDFFVEGEIHSCEESAKKIRYMAEEARDDLKTEMKRLNQRRENFKEELDAIERKKGEDENG